MKETTNVLNGAIIESIESYIDGDLPFDSRYKGEYGGFCLRIKTDKGIFIYEGCHDCSPDIEIKDVTK